MESGQLDPHTLISPLTQQRTRVVFGPKRGNSNKMLSSLLKKQTAVTKKGGESGQSNFRHPNIVLFKKSSSNVHKDFTPATVGNPKKASKKNLSFV